jgi:nucleotide-binding universal stress UspA family protein
MYKKVLVPMADTDNSRSVIKALSDLVAEDGEAVLLHIISPVKTKGHGDFAVPGTQVEEDNRNRALIVLNRLVDELKEASINATCTVVVSNSVPGCIVNYADTHGADLIAMYTHRRTGIAKLLKSSTTNDVRTHTRIEVQGFASPELALIGSS